MDGKRTLHGFAIQGLSTAYLLYMKDDGKDPAAAKVEAFFPWKDLKSRIFE